MKACLTFLLAFICLFPQAQGRELVGETENNALHVRLYDDGGMAILHKSNDVTWISRVPEDVQLDVSQVRSTNGLQWVVRFDNKAWHVSAELHKAGCTITLTGPDDAPMGNPLPYPFALMPPDGSWEAVMPQSEGMLLNVTDALFGRAGGWYGCYSNNGLAMPWFGLTDLQSGMLTLFETPDDCGVDMQVRSLDGEGVWHPQPLWQPSRHQARYPRRLQYQFFESGGYVAMAKWYRARLLSQGKLVTLREKAKAMPQLERLVGAMDIHVRGQAEEALANVTWFRDQGARKMLIHSGVDKQYQDAYRDMGFLPGYYDIYTDIHPPDSLGNPSSREKYATGFPDDAYTMENGMMVRGFGFSRGSGATYRCSSLQLPLMRKLIPPILQERGYDAYFLDVVTTAGFRDCWSSRHPLNHTEDKEERIKVLQYCSEELDLITGSEDGLDWSAPYVHYYEGMVMLRRFGYMPGIYASNFKKKFTLNEEYRHFNLNERVRIPLFELVWHDALVSTWRWNFTPDRYQDTFWWDKHDLMNVMTGTMPIFVLDDETLRERGARMMQTYRDVCRLNETTGWQEMIEHKFLTPDRTVHLVRYANGVTVIINFDREQIYTHPDGTKVAAMGYTVLK